jgi:hypothetical protein
VFNNLNRAATSRCPFGQRRCERGASGPLSNGVKRGSPGALILAHSCRFRPSASGGVRLSVGFASRRSPVRSRNAPLNLAGAPGQRPSASSTFAVGM